MIYYLWEWELWWWRFSPSLHGRGEDEMMSVWNFNKFQATWQNFNFNLLCVYSLHELFFLTFFLLLFPLLPLLLLHTLHNISVSQLCLDIIHCRYAEYSEICVNIWWGFVMPVLPPTPVCGGDGDDDSGKTHNIRLFRNIRGECVFDKMMGYYQRIFSFSPEV